MTEADLEENTIDTKKRKIYVENNIIIGIDSSDNNDKICKDIDDLTKELSSDSVIKSKFVLICNIDPIIEHCDIITLCKDISFPISLNYFRGSFGRAWLKFENHQIALKIINKLNKFKLEDKKLMVGLIENTPKYIDIKQSLTNYNITKNKAYPVNTSKKTNHSKQNKTNHQTKNKKNKQKSPSSKKKKQKKIKKDQKQIVV